MQILDPNGDPAEKREPAEKKAHRDDGVDRRKKLTDTDIVAGLRSEEPARRKEALEALCGIDSGVMIVTTAKDTRLIATNKIEAPRVFSAMLFLMQQIGKTLGLALHWVPEQQEDPTQKLVVAQEGDLPKPPPRG